MLSGLDSAEIMGLLVLVTGSFAATNLDNLLILVIMLGTAPKRRPTILLGYLASSIVLISIAAVGVAVGAYIDPALVGYLGLAPLGLGCYLLQRQWRGGETTASDRPPVNRGDIGLGIASFSVMFSNSGDSLAIFLPLLSESSREALLLAVAFYLLSVLVWATLSLVIAGNEQLARRIERVGGKLVPWIMILVGLYILADTGTDTLL